MTATTPLEEARRLALEGALAKAEQTRQRERAIAALEECRRICERFGFDFHLIRQGVEVTHGRQQETTDP